MLDFSGCACAEFHVLSDRGNLEPFDACSDLRIFTYELIMEPVDLTIGQW